MSSLASTTSYSISITSDGAWESQVMVVPQQSTVTAACLETAGLSHLFIVNFTQI